MIVLLARKALAKEGKKMAKYEVRIDERLTHSLQVEANSEQEARKIGWEIVMNSPESDYITESNGTQVADAWQVEEEVAR